MVVSQEVDSNYFFYLYIWPDLTELRMNFIMLINVKMPTIVGI